MVGRLEGDVRVTRLLIKSPPTTRTGTNQFGSTESAHLDRMSEPCVERALVVKTRLSLSDMISVAHYEYSIILLRPSDPSTTPPRPSK